MSLGNPYYTYFMTNTPFYFSICDSHSNEIRGGKRVTNYKWNKDLLLEYCELFPPVSRHIPQNIEQMLILRAPFRGREFGELWELFNDIEHEENEKCVEFINSCMRERAKPDYINKFCEFIKTKKEQVAGKKKTHFSLVCHAYFAICHLYNVLVPFIMEVRVWYIKATFKL